MSAREYSDQLSEFLKFERKKYTFGQEDSGGTASGFRAHIAKQADVEPLKFKAFEREALMIAATKTWQAPPRRRGPDLFSVGDFDVAEYLTRPKRGYFGVDEDADPDGFEKVDQHFATVADFQADATIKMRKAAQSSAAAERQMKAVDEARKRAGGDMAAKLRDLADQKPKGDA